ncbi:MAG: hypothetical protein IKW48_05670, partial [Akkermansia sp.]|nr:hypothetical protein [Akkermansia sp.]
HQPWQGCALPLSYIRVRISTFSVEAGLLYSSLRRTQAFFYGKFKKTILLVLLSASGKMVAWIAFLSLFC